MKHEGCVRYIFACLFCMSKREHSRNKEKCFYFTSKAHILLNNLASKHSLVMKFGKFMYYYKINFFIEKLYEKCGLETTC